MLHKIIVILKVLVIYSTVGETEATIGKIARDTGYSYSTIRRVVNFAVKRGLMSEAAVPYKATGKWIVWSTVKGYELMISQMEMKL